MHALYGVAAGCAMFLSLMAGAAAVERLSAQRYGATAGYAAAGLALMALALGCFAASMMAGWADMLPEGL